MSEPWKTIPPANIAVLNRSTKEDAGEREWNRFLLDEHTGVTKMASFHRCLRCVALGLPCSATRPVGGSAEARYPCVECEHALLCRDEAALTKSLLRKEDERIEGGQKIITYVFPGDPPVVRTQNDEVAQMCADYGPFWPINQYFLMSAALRPSMLDDLTTQYYSTQRDLALQIYKKDLEGPRELRVPPHVGIDLDAAAAAHTTGAAIISLRLSTENLHGAALELMLHARKVFAALESQLGLIANPRVIKKKEVSSSAYPVVRAAGVAWARYVWKLPADESPKRKADEVEVIMPMLPKVITYTWVRHYLQGLWPHVEERAVDYYSTYLTTTGLPVDRHSADFVQRAVEYWEATSGL